MGEAALLDLQEQQFADYTHRNAEAVVAMGMTGQIVKFWSGFRQSSINRLQIGSERGERIAAMSKAFRMLLQSAILALWVPILPFYKRSHRGRLSQHPLLQGVR